MKQAILAIIVLFAIPFSFAIIAESADIGVDFTFKPAINASTAVLSITSIINPLARNDTKGYLTRKITAPVVPVSSVGGAGGYSKQGVTLYYDVI